MLVNEVISEIRDRKINDAKIQLILGRVVAFEEKYKSNERLYSVLKYLDWELSALIQFKYTVTDVVDGDTIKVSYNWVIQTIRILWLDTPEKYATRTGYQECYGEEASQYAHTLLDNKMVMLESDETQDEFDKYGRLLAHVYYLDENWEKVLFQKQMIRQGYGFHYLYKKPVKYANMLKVAESFAKNENIGVWKECEGKRIPLNSSSQWEWTLDNETQEAVNNIFSGDVIDVGTDEEEVNDNTLKCWAKTKCSEMDSCDEAKYYLEKCGLSSLDGNKDWVPCNSICK